MENFIGQLINKHAHVKITEDKELREKLTEEGKKTAKVDFSIKRVIENYEDVFEKLIHQ